jgi:outer membrane protein assembly factor BamB
MIAPLLAATALAAAAPVPHDWTRFGYNAARSNSSPYATGITAANAAQLQRQRIDIDGTVDSSPIFLHSVTIAGATHDAFFVTTTYGRTLAIDATTGRVLWRYTPSGYSSWAGSYRITNATPVADPSRTAIYTASPDGRIHKLSVLDGTALWSTAITRLPQREKIAASLNFAGGRVIATTGGYLGDAQPYQGHVVTLNPATGAIVRVWNSLCSNRHAVMEPSSCGASDSAMWARAGAVVEPATGRLLVATGNGPWNGRTNWGDSVLELSGDAARLLQNWTPRNQAQLGAGDVDLGSTAPALVGGSLAVQGGKDGLLRLLSIRRLNGTAHAGTRLGGELQTVSAPGRTGVFTAPAVWRSGRTTWVFVATNGGTGAFRLVRGRLRGAWQNRFAGTSPVVAGGLLYVYDPNGALRIYRPTSSRPLATLSAGGGHWNSPIVVAGRVIVPEGDANDHRQSGVVDLYRLPSGTDRRGLSLSSTSVGYPQGTVPSGTVPFRARALDTNKGDSPLRGQSLSRFADASRAALADRAPRTRAPVATRSASQARGRCGGAVPACRAGA